MTDDRRTGAVSARAWPNKACCHLYHHCCTAGHVRTLLHHVSSLCPPSAPVNGRSASDWKLLHGRLADHDSLNTTLASQRRRPRSIICNQRLPGPRFTSEIGACSRCGSARNSLNTSHTWLGTSVRCDSRVPCICEEGRAGRGKSSTQQPAQVARHTTVGHMQHGPDIGVYWQPDGQ